MDRKEESARVMATINGTAGNDVLNGSSGDDIIKGNDGNDRINGGAGNDIIYGGAGADTLVGDAGSDAIFGGEGNDGIYGGGGDDVIYGENGDDTMFGDAGNDTIYGGDGNDKLSGGAGDDVLVGGAGINTYDGGAGVDTVIVDIASADLSNAMLADLASLKGFMDGQLASAGSVAALSTQTSGPSLSLATLGITISNIETFVLRVDGVETPLSSLINQAPTAAAEATILTTEDAPVSSSIVATDTNGDTLSYAVTTGPANGTLVLDAATGAYTYTPHADFNGADSFVVNVADPSGLTTTQTIHVNVGAVNDAPVTDTAVPLSTTEDTAVSGHVVATDVEGDVLTYGLADVPTYGQVVLNPATGAYTYTPNANFNGSDSFKVVVADPSGATAVQTVTVGVAPVNDAPVSDAAASIVTNEDTAVKGQVVATDVDGDTLAYVVSQSPANGMVTIDSTTGAYTYKPNADFNGSDSFKVVVADPSGATSVQTITVGIASVNDAPSVLGFKSLTTDEDVAVKGQVVATDVDGDVLGYAVSEGPANGTLTLDSATGAYTYTPHADFNGADSFKVVVADPSGATSVQTVVVGVASVNDAPVASAEAAIVTNEDTAVSGKVVATDVDGDALTFTVSQGPAHGTLSIDAATGQYTYTGAANYAGSDKFVVDVTDGAGGHAQQTVKVGIAAVADAPALTTSDVVVPSGITVIGTSGNDTLTGSSGDDKIYGGAGDDTIYGDGPAVGKTAALPISATLTDRDGSESLSVSIAGVPSGVSLSAGTMAADGTWKLTPAQLAGLNITSATGAAFDLTVKATATEANGSTATTTQALHVSFDGGTNSDLIDGGAGNDKIYGGTGNNTLIDGDGNDFVYGNGGDDTFIVGLGNDTYDGGTGFDTIDLSSATQGMKADLAKSTLTGMGTDKLVSIEGIVGSAFNDTLTGSAADNKIAGAAGDDQIYGGAGSDTLWGGDGNDQIDGGSGNDVIYDGAGNDTVTAGDGDDIIYAGSGLDKYVGGSGFDTLDYSGATGPVSVDASSKTIIGYTSDTMDGIEKVIGTSFDDVFKGGKSSNFFDGGAGNDTFRGMGGADTFTGGTGADVYNWYVKDVLSGVNYLGADRITDFGAGDKLNLHEFVKAFPGAQIDSVVKMTDSVQGTMVSVKVGIGFLDLVMLDNIHQTSASQMLANGQILT